MEFQKYIQQRIADLTKIRNIVPLTMGIDNAIKVTKTITNNDAVTNVMTKMKQGLEDLLSKELSFEEVDIYFNTTYPSFVASVIDENDDNSTQKEILKAGFTKLCKALSITICDSHIDEFVDISLKTVMRS